MISQITNGESGLSVRNNLNNLITQFQYVINVKDYGALGDGSTDDTAAIQSAFDAAFGPASAPHKDTNATSNKPVFFPNGDYKVSCPQTSVTGANAGAGGQIQLLVTSTTGFSTKSQINVASVTGTTEANGTWFIASIDGPTSLTLLASTFTNAWIVGGTVTGAALLLYGVQGAHIYGAGRFTTKISTAASGGIVIAANGLGYSVIERLQISGGGTGSVCFDLNWDHISPISTQSNRFSDMYIQSADIGLQIGMNGSMSSETFLENCFFSANAVAGIKIGNANALQTTMLGGDIQSCGKGIWVYNGSCNVIAGVGFQGSTAADIYIQNSSDDTYHISGCRTESVNFLDGLPDPLKVVITGCTQLSSTPGFFVHGIGNSEAMKVVIDGCQSQAGQISGGGFSSPRVLSIRGSSFRNWGFLTPFTGWANIENCSIGSSTVICRYIQLQDINNGAIRTYNIQGAALTDASVLYDCIAGVAVAFSNGSSNITLAGHELLAGMPVAFTTTGGLPTNFSIGTTYYVLAAGLTANTFRVATTPGGTAISAGSAGTGTQSVNLVRTYAVGDQILKSNVAAGGSPGWICTTAGEAVGTAVFKALANISA